MFTLFILYILQVIRLNDNPRYVGGQILIIETLKNKEHFYTMAEIYHWRKSEVSVLRLC